MERRGRICDAFLGVSGLLAVCMTSVLLSQKATKKKEKPSTTSNCGCCMRRHTAPSRSACMLPTASLVKWPHPDIPTSGSSSCFSVFSVPSSVAADAFLPFASSQNALLLSEASSLPMAHSSCKSPSCEEISLEFAFLKLCSFPPPPPTVPQPVPFPPLNQA